MLSINHEILERQHSVSTQPAIPYFQTRLDHLNLDELKN